MLPLRPKIERPRRRDQDGRTGLLVLFLASLGGVASTVAADWREDFAAGIMARDRGDWGEAVTMMRSAIEENPRAKGKVRVYGMKYEPYLPYYYLGVALYNVGDCRAALDAFEESRTQDHAGPAARGKMNRVEKKCFDKLGISSPPPAPPPSRPSWPSPPPTRPSPPPSRPSPPPPPRPPAQAGDVRRQIVQEKAEEVRKVLRSVSELVSAVDRHLASTGETVFRRKPHLKERYQASYRKLNGTRSLLRAAEKEGDVQALDKALVRAEEVRGEFEHLAREMGVRRR